MRKYIFFLALGFTFFGGKKNVHSQSIVGSWEGVLRTKAINIPIVFHFGMNKNTLLATMDSPEQNGYDIPADSVGFSDSLLTIKNGQLRMVYRGKMTHRDTIKGIFEQNGRTIGITFVRVGNKPKSSYLLGFEEELVFVKNKKASITLGATLTYPKKGKKFPTVVLISGSGPQDRDASLFGKKLFKTIAEHFTRSGYAVLRFDDRGTAKSTGNFASATSFDFAEDVESILSYLRKHKKIDKDKIGLMGHSEGSLIASIVASRNKNVAFVLSVAGPGIKGDSLILSQARLIMEGNNMSEERVNATLALNRSIYKVVLGGLDSIGKDKQIKEIVYAHYKSQKDSTSPDQIARLAKSLALQSNNDWFENFLAYDPAAYWTLVKCPVFAVNGVKDVQVPAVANLMGIKRNLEKGENYDVKIKMYPGLNHLFQTCETGLPREYPNLTETFSGLVLNDMVSWMNDIIRL